ncbi:hypothetical protein C4K39_2830 [Pseudomonas sessilinigenes]|nr:hypothetical protein C4K39_2830 [Pseudomonas sessilinigenes]
MGKVQGSRAACVPNPQRAVTSAEPARWRQGRQAFNDPVPPVAPRAMRSLRQRLHGCSAPR